MIKKPLNALARHFAEQRFWRWATPLLAPGLALANPTGADIVAGDVAITNTDPNTLTINQGSATASINWQTFSIGSAEYVIFNQPSASALALNRVIGGTPSEIFGHLLSNGRIFLINPNGVLFGASATIDVGALVASTANLSDADFASGRYVFTGAGPGAIVNSGRIIAGPAGFVVLAADSVTNNGLIQANLGEVVLAAGNAFTLDLTGEGLINFTVDQAALSSQSGVSNLGQLVADGGKVLMTARTAADLARTVVNNQGLVQAHSISQTDSGEIVLEAAGGDVANAGTLDASGVNGADGGTVALVGDHAVKLAPTSAISTVGDGALAHGGGVHLSGHTVSVRGLVNIGRGGRFVLDPAVVHIYDGAGPNSSNGTSGFISEQFVENQLQSGVNVTIVASQRITLDNLSDNLLNGVDAASGAADDGSLLLGIGAVTGGSSNGVGFGSFLRGPGTPGGGINFMDANDAVIVGRNLKLIAGSANGDINVGNLTAGGDIDLEAFGNITAGNVVANGGDALVAAQHGNINLNSIEVYTGLAGPLTARLEMDAYGSSAGAGNITVAGMVEVSNDQYLSSLVVNAGGKVDVGNLTMHGGGGSAPGPGSNLMVNANVNAGAIVIHSADITTDNFTRSFSSSSGADGTSHFSSHGDADVHLMANGAAGDITLGDVAGGQFAITANGDAALNLNAGRNITLNNVAVTALAAYGEGSSHYAGSFGGSPATLFNGGFSHSYAMRGDAHLIAFAGGSLSVPTGGAVSVTADGFAQVGLNAGQGLNVDGQVTVTANAATGGFSSGNFFSSTAGSYIRNSTHSTFSRGTADLLLQAGNEVHVGAGGTVTVTGTGKAIAALRSTQGGGVTLDGILNVTANKGAFSQSNSHFTSAAPSASPRNYNRQNGQLGDADVTLQADSGSYGSAAVKIGNAAVINVVDYGGDVPSGSSYAAGALTANVDLWAYGDVVIGGDIHITGNQGEFHKNSLQSNGGYSYGDFYAGGARLDLNAGAGDITVDSTASLDVHGYGIASFNARASNGNVEFDGDLKLKADTAQFTQARRSVFGSASSNSASSGAYATAFGNINAGGDIIIGATGALNLTAPLHVDLTLNANRDGSSGQGLAVDGDITLLAAGGVAHKKTTGYSSADSGTTHLSSGTDGQAHLDLSGSGVAINGDVSVTAYGSADASIRSDNGGGMAVAGGITITGDRAFSRENGSHRFSFGSTTTFFDGSGSRGAAALHLSAFGGTYGAGDMTLGPTATLQVTDFGGNLSSPAALVDVFANGDLTVAGDITVDGNRGWHHSHSSGQNFSNHSYADRGGAQLNLRANGDIGVLSTATLDLHAYGNVGLSVNAQGSSATLLMDGQAHLLAERGVQTGDSSHTSGSVLYQNSYADNAGDARMSLYARGDLRVGSSAVIDISGAGYAGFSAYTSAQGASYGLAINGPVTVTASRGLHMSRNERGHFTSTDGGIYVRDSLSRDGSSEGPPESFGTADINLYSYPFAASSGVGNVVVNAALKATGSGSAHVSIYGRDVTINAPITLTAKQGHFAHTSFNRSSFSCESYGAPCTQDRGSASDRGSADLTLQAVNQLSLNSSVSVIGHGNANANLYGSNSVSTAAAIDINAPLTVTDLGGNGTFSNVVDLDFGSNSFLLANTRHISSGGSFVGYGSAHLGLNAGGAYGDIVISSGGSISVTGPANATLDISTPRDLVIGGAVAVDAMPGYRNTYKDTTQARTYASDSHTLADVQHDFFEGYSGRAALTANSGLRNVLINAPVSVSGNGRARLQVSGANGNISIAAPVSVTDAGSAYRTSHTYSSNAFDAVSAGGAQRRHYTSFSSTGGITGSFAHSGNAQATFSLTGDFDVGATGAITVSGVEDATLSVQTFGSSSAGAIRIHGPVSVAATPNDYLYRYGSDSTSVAGANPYDYTYRYNSSSAHGVASLDLSAARELAVYGGGGGVSMSGYGGVRASLRSGGQQDVTLNGPIVLNAQAGKYHSDSDWQFDSTGPGSTYHSDSGSFYTSNGGYVSLSVGASRNIVVGAGGITANAAGSIGVTLNAGSGGYGDITINGPINLMATKVYSSSSGSHNDSSGTGPGSKVFHYTASSSDTSSSAGINLQMHTQTNSSGAYGGNIVIAATGGINAQGYGDVFIYGQARNNFTVNGAVNVVSRAGHFEHHQASTGNSVNSAGTAGSASNSLHMSSSDYGSAQVSFQANRGQMLVGANGISVQGYGDASVDLTGAVSYSSTAPQALSVQGPITVTAHAGTFKQSFASGSSNFTVNSLGAHITGSFSNSSSHRDFTGGTADINLYTYYGNVAVGAAGALTARADAGQAGVSIRSSIDSVTVAAPVVATGGHAQFSRDRTFSSSSSGSHQQSHSAFSSSGGGARIDITAGLGVTVSNTLTATGYGDGSFSSGGLAALSSIGSNGGARINLTANGGDVTVTGAITATAFGAKRHFSGSSSFLSGGSSFHTSSGSIFDGSYGAAAVSARSNFTSAGGDVQLAAVTVNGAGQAGASFNAANGAITLNGPVTITSGRGTFTSSGHRLYNPAGAYFSSSYGASNGQLGYGSLYVRGVQGVSGAGAITIGAEGSASASIYADNGGVNLSGPISITSTKGTLSGSHFSEFTNSAGTFHNRNSRSSNTYGGRANLEVRAYNGGNVTLGGINLSGYGDGSSEGGGMGGARAYLYAASGGVTVNGGISVVDTRAPSHFQSDHSHQGSGFSSSGSRDSNSSAGRASLDAFALTGVTLSQGAIVTGDGRAEASINAPTITIGGPLSVTANKGDFGIDGSHGDASLDLSAGGSSAAISATDITVTGNGFASAYLNALTMDVDNLTVHANSGTYAGSSSAAPLAQFGDAHLTVLGSYNSSSSAFGAHVGNLVADGRTIALTGAVFADAVGFSAKDFIDMTGSRLGLGSGAAPFGADNIVQFLLNVQVPGLFGSVTPNGGFSAPVVSFGSLNLAGSAIFIQADDVSYSGTIAITSTTLPPAGYVIRYDTFTPDATVHIVSALPTTPIPGDVYYDSGDFAYPGTTYLIGGTYSFSPILVGEIDPQTGLPLTPSGGNGGDDNFIFLTNSDVAFTTDIPTSGQVLVIHPLATSGGFDVPTSADWGGDQGGGGAEGDTKKENLEHEQQPQTSGGGEGEEGQIDNESGANLECH